MFNPAKYFKRLIARWRRSKEETTIPAVRLTSELRNAEIQEGREIIRRNERRIRDIVAERALLEASTHEIESQYGTLWELRNAFKAFLPVKQLIDQAVDEMPDTQYERHEGTIDLIYNNFRKIHEYDAKITPLLSSGISSASQSEMRDLAFSFQQVLIESLNMAMGIFPDAAFHAEANKLSDQILHPDPPFPSAGETPGMSP